MAIQRGEFVVVVDDIDRENEGDLILAAEKVTPDKVAFMMRHTSGIICVPMRGPLLEQLAISDMVVDNQEAHRTAFTVSVDARTGITTGTSASDRSTTIEALADPRSKPSDLTRPGHVFPLRYTEGGVLKRAGHTEAAVDLAQLAGLQPIGVISELVDRRGQMMSGRQLKAFATRHRLNVLSVAELVRHRRKHEKLVVLVSSARVPTVHGDWTAYVFRSLLDGIEHVAYVMGEVSGRADVLVRVHSECLTGDTFGSLRCDCGSQLELSQRRIAAEGRGVVVYLRGHEGRGIGIGHKLRAYTLQEAGRDTVEANEDLGFPADDRDYGIGAQVCVELGLSTIRVLTNNPAKYLGLSGYQLAITGRVPLLTPPHPENIRYLRTKQMKLGHHLQLEPYSEPRGPRRVGS